jgi:hypothetical protein
MLGACSDDNDKLAPQSPSQPAGAAGTLEYSWSINGRQVAEDCVDVEAILFESVIVDQGFVIGRVRAPCEDFEASLSLYRSDFLARSSLTDVNGFAALRRIVEDTFVIESGEVTRLVMDFPSAAVPMAPEADAGGVDSADAGGVDSADTGASEPAADAGADGGLP